MADELINRQALERIVKRAAELQAGEREIGDGLTQGEVMALGKDVGIPDRFLRQAMLEEQTRTAPEAPAGWWAWLTGPSALVAHRVVPGDRDAIETALAQWMREEELLQPKRRHPDRTVWERKAGAFASIQRALAGGRKYSLAQLEDITSQVVPLESGFCLVRFEANIRQQRAGRVGGGIAMAVGGAGVSAALVAIGLPLPLLADVAALLPGVALAAGGAAVARSYGAPNERITVALEQLLDHLEHGEMRAGRALPKGEGAGGTFQRIAEEIRKSLQF
jgi:hypothetical protein